MGERGGGGGGGGEWIRLREAGAPSRFREGFDGEGMTGMEGGKPFHRWQMHLPKRCGRFCLVLRRHAACRYYSAFLFFTHCYPSRPPKILMLFVRNNRGIYFSLRTFSWNAERKREKERFLFLLLILSSRIMFVKWTSILALKFYE